MKFAHSIVLNAVPEWLDKYVDYDRLKKLVYQAERDRVEQQNAASRNLPHKIEEGLQEKAHLDAQATGSDRASALTVTHNDQFLVELDAQLEKVSNFFAIKEDEFLRDTEEIEAEFNTFNIPLPDDTQQPVETIPTQNPLEKLDSTRRSFSRRRSSRRDSEATFLSSESESEYDVGGRSINRLDIVPSKSNTLSEKPPSLLPNSIQEAENEDDEEPAINPTSTTALQRSATTVGFSSATNKQLPTRSNTVGSNFRSRRGSAIERTLSQHDAMPAYAENNKPARIMRAGGFKFGRRRGSHISVRQPSDVSEFNQYFNFRVRCAATYISLIELKAYADTNKTAFDKILKKWDKVTGSNLREAYYKKIVDTTHAFTPANIQRIQTAIDLILSIYAAVFTLGRKDNAEIELKMHMRDHIQFERNTVWKDLVGKERQTMDAHADIPRKGYHIPYIHVFVSHKTLFNIFGFLVSLILYIVLMCVDTMGDYEASKCLALLVFAALMWAFECIPLFATAFLIPCMIVPMHIIKDGNGNLLDSTSAAKAVFSSMFSDTIMVLLGGFAIAAALSKHGIAKAFASTVLSKAGTRPRWVILVNMYLATFLSMWISNVATPVLCFSLVDPILRTLRPKSTVAPCLLMAIALASCIGGLSSPISSPQNIVTINLMDPNPGWGIWFAGAIPVFIITNITTWALLLLYFRPDRDTPHLNVIKSQKFVRPSYSQVWVCIVCLATIALWCAESAMNDFWGDNGTIAAIPIVLLFGTNMLSKSDLNNFLWSVVTLAQGGMALGYAVQHSGLLSVIGNQIASNVNGKDIIAILFIFGMLVLVFATFVSHTVAALVILPIVKEVGQNLPVPRPNLLVMVTGLVCSVAMGLPVSGFPNMSAIMLEDPTGQPYLRIKDFLLIGLPSSIVASVITILLGYGIVSGVGY